MTYAGEKLSAREIAGLALMFCWLTLLIGLLLYGVTALVWSV